MPGKSSRNRVVLGSTVSLAHCGTIGIVIWQIHSFDLRGCDIHESIHKIRHGDAVPYDKAKAKEYRTPPVGSMEWYEQAKKDGTLKVYRKRKGG